MKAAVLGHPIAHSLSPVLHRAAYEALGLRRWTYEAIDVDLPALPGVIRALDEGWAGLSLTMPLKQDVIGLLDEVSDLARAVGAVNTVVPTGAGGWRGENTDVAGVLGALAEAGVTTAGTAAVLGAGATASSSLAALAQAGVVRVDVHVRSAPRADGLRTAARRLGITVALAPWPVVPADLTAILDAEVVVACAPAGAADAVATLLRHGDTPAPRGTLLDVAYDRRPSALQTAWAAAGGTTAEGTDMLLHQGARQVQLMTGRPAPVQVMRVALEKALTPYRHLP